MLVVWGGKVGEMGKWGDGGMYLLRRGRRRWTWWVVGEIMRYVWCGGVVW